MQLQLWEQIALGAIILIIMVWQFPKISATLKADADAPKDWQGLLLPIICVIGFVLLLVQLA